MDVAKYILTVAIIASFLDKFNSKFGVLWDCFNGAFFLFFCGALYYKQRLIWEQLLYYWEYVY